MSEFKVEIVRIGEVRKLPNSDKLQVTDVHGGYPCISQLGTFKQGDLAVYVPIDSLVPASHPDFEFLVPTPMRKPDMTDIEWGERLRRHEREKTGKVRVKARKLRGTFSMGLLIPLKELTQGRSIWLLRTLDACEVEVHEGDDVQALLGIEKYEPDEANTKSRASGPQGPGGTVESCPFFIPVYTDIEGLRQWGRILQEGEEVIITEKIHDQNARFVHDGNRLWVGSHYQIKRPPRIVLDADIKAYRRADLWWQILHPFYRLLALLGLSPKEPKRPREPIDVPMTNWWRVSIDNQLPALLSMIPNLVLFGEVYGSCQDLKYGSPDGLKFRAFDAYDLNWCRYLDYDDFKRKMDLLGIETVPVLYRGPWSEECRKLAEGKTTVGGDHVREGIVIRPAHERTHERLGRVILKLVGEGYHLR